MKLLRRDDIILGSAGALIGIALAAAYAAFRAFNDNGSRWSTLADNMLFPGLLIVATVTAMVWLGWKANIDG